jgi:hypothetical protein
VAHVFGGGLGGLIIGVLLAVVGLAIRELAHTEMPGFGLIALPTLAVLTGLVDLKVLRMHAISPTRQTAGGWTCAFGPLAGIFAWGVDLGLIVTTRISYQITFVVIAFALFSGNLGYSVLATMGFGVSRALATAIFALRAGDHLREQCDLINDQQLLMRRVAGAAALGAAAILYCAGLVVAVSG